MQDGAPCHLSYESMDVVEELFGDLVISQRHKNQLLGGMFQWAASSPDLNPCDYWLWNELKEYARQGKVRTMDDLVAAIEGFFGQLKAQPHRLKKAVHGLPERLRACIAKDGHIVNGKNWRKKAIAACPEVQALEMPCEQPQFMSPVPTISDPVHYMDQNIFGPSSAQFPSLAPIELSSGIEQADLGGQLFDMDQPAPAFPRVQPEPANPFSRRYRAPQDIGPMPFNPGFDFDPYSTW